MDHSGTKFNAMQRFLIWLSGSSEDHLRECQRWEQRKYEAFGATVLVPTIFAMVASAYAVSTLTQQLWVIIPIAILWGFIILSIDRALLTTYRAFANPFIKISQFALRIVVALLIGFTIAHPLTLLLFKDTITSQIERERAAEIQAIRDGATDNKDALEQRIAASANSLATQQQVYQDTVSAKFLKDGANPAAAEAPVVVEGAPTQREALEARVTQATQAQKAQIAEIDAQMAQHNENYAKVQTELSNWQEQYEAEIDGTRSGASGIGPRAKSIEQDHLVWRRDEVKRLGGIMTSLTQARTQLTNDIASTEKTIRDDYNAALAADSAAKRADQQEVATLERDLKKQQLNIFMDQQDDLLAQIQTQIDSHSAEVTRLRDEANLLATDTQNQIAGVQNQTRQDLLTQTLVLHSLFGGESEGGAFALMVYVVIAALFMLVDTIPLVVKFFSKAGPYDYYIYQDEERAKLLKDDQAALSNLENVDEASVARRKIQYYHLKNLQDEAFTMAFGLAPTRPGRREALLDAEPVIPMLSAPLELAAARASEPPVNPVAAGGAQQQLPDSRIPAENGSNGRGDRFFPENGGGNGHRDAIRQVPTAPYSQNGNGNGASNGNRDRNERFDPRPATTTVAASLPVQDELPLENFADPPSAEPAPQSGPELAELMADEIQQPWPTPDRAPIESAGTAYDSEIPEAFLPGQFDDLPQPQPPTEEAYAAAAPQNAAPDTQGLLRLAKQAEELMREQTAEATPAPAQPTSPSPAPAPAPNPEEPAAEWMARLAETGKPYEQFETEGEVKTRYSATQA